MFVEQETGVGTGCERGSRASGCSTKAPLGVLERRIRELSVDINAATCRWLELVAEFDLRSGHERAGFLSCTAWLAWSCGLTPRAARERLRVAHSLAALPRIRAAFSAGRISYSKARALTRVATPAFEAELLEVAEHATAAQLERVVRGLRQAWAEAGPEEPQERRHLALRWEVDGMLRVSGRLPAEEGEQLIKAVEAAREALRRDGRNGEHLPDGRNPAQSDPPDRADGLTALAEGFLAHGPLAAAGGERNQVVVHVDLDQLSAANAAGGGDSCTATQTDADAGEATGAGLPIGDGAHRAGRVAAVGVGGFVAATAAQRIACDAALVTLVERAGEPVSVGRKRRTIPPAVLRALRARDRGCRFPGCTHERYVDAHHIRHWAGGGETSLDNLVLLCRRHHRLVHEGGFSLGRDERGEPSFRRPDGRPVDGGPSRERPRRLRRVSPAPPNRATGELLDLDHAVLALAASASVSSRGSA